MASVFTVLTKLEADVSNFAAGMAKAQKSLDNLEKAVGSAGGKINTDLTGKSNTAVLALGKLGGALAAVAIAGAGIKKAADGIQGLTKAASSFETEFIGVEQTFGEGADVVKKFAETAAYTAGISETSALRFSKSFGGFARSAGLAGEAQGQFSTSLVKLAGDLSSFYDTSPEDALAAISAGLRGEFEPLRRYNILLNDNALKQEAMNKGIYNGVGNLSMSNRVLAAHTAIMNQAGIAQNDFTNFSDAYSNVMFTNQALIQNLSADLGTVLLPAMARLAQAFTPIIENAGPRLEKVIQGVVPIIEALIKAIEPINEAMNPMLEAFVPIMELIANLVNQIMPPFVEIIGALTPIVNDLVQALAPLADEILTYIGTILSDWIVPIIKVFAVALRALVPAIEFIANLFEMIMPVLSGFANIFNDVVGPALDDFISWLMPALPQLEAQFSSVFDSIGQAVSWVYENILKPVFGGIIDFMRDVLGIDIGKEFAAFGKAFEIGFNQAKTRLADYSFIGEDARFKAIEDGKKTGYATGAAFTGGLQNNLKTKGGEKAVDAFRALLDEFTNDIKKQEAKIKLASMGLSTALVEKILGSSDWQKIYDRIIKGGKKTATELQNLFNKTSAVVEKTKEYLDGVKEMFGGFKILPANTVELGRFEEQIAGIANSAREKLAEGVKLELITSAQRAELDKLVATHETAMRSIAKQRDALEKKVADTLAIKQFGVEFNKSAKMVMDSVLPLQRATRVIGEFESAVIDSFKNVLASVQDAQDAGYFTETLASTIKKSAATTEVQLRALARQRDALTKEYEQFTEKLNAAKEFRKATADAVKGYANITSVGKSARTMVKNLGVIVQRTEVFRQQLSTLNQMGLNKELYRQIVESGLDAGTATAKALLKGGPKAVDEVNALFAKLDETSALLADDTTKVMYDGGEQVIQGFIDGVLAKDEQVRLEADKIATTFNTAFQGTLDTATTNIDALIASLESQKSTLETTAVSLAAAFNTAFQNALQLAIDANKPAEVDNSAKIKELDTKIKNAKKYIQNINDPKKEAGALKKLQGYIEQRGALVNAASGGYIRGAGTGTSDSIPARLSNGEFVMSARAVDKFGAGFMSAINSGRVPAFASGGGVSSARIITGGGGKTVINNKYEINVRTGIGDPAAIGKQVVSAIAAYEKTSGRQIL